jgi:hypothetical protein
MVRVWFDGNDQNGPKRRRTRRSGHMYVFFFVFRVFLTYVFYILLRFYLFFKRERELVWAAATQTGQNDARHVLLMDYYRHY